MKNQTERVTHYETIFDELSAALRRVDEAVEALQALCPLVGALDAYYTGEAWKADFAADEAGLLPPTLKRGVLSEDGVNDLLDGIRAVYDFAER